MSLSLIAKPLESLWNQGHLMSVLREFVLCVPNGLEYLKGAPISTKKAVRLSPLSGHFPLLINSCRCP